MKKILAILISVLLLLNTTAIIFAEEDITIDVQFNEETKEFTISGYIKYERDRIPVALYMTHEDGNTVSITETIATGIEEEGIPYTFSNIKLKNSTRTGDISIRVATGELDFVNETSYHYLGIDRQFTALITLKSAIESGNYDTLKSAILSTKSELGIDDTLFLNLLSEKSPYIAMNNLFGLTIAQIEGWNIDNLTDEQCAKIEEQVKLYQKQYKEAVQLGEFFDCTTVAELKAWYDANKTEYGFLLDNGETAVDERKLIDYFDQAVLVEAFTQRKQNIEFVKTMKELNLEMKKQAVLQIVADSNQSEILNIISNLSVLLSNVYDANGQNPVSVNYTDWNSLSSNQKTAVCINIAGNSYRDIYEFVSAVNTQISLNKGTVVTGTPDRGESTGGRGGKGNSDVFMPLPDTNEVTNSVLSFKDIENVKLVGFLTGEKLIEFMGQAKVLLVPSIWYENCPLSILEAQCMGVPVATVNNGGMAELVKDGITGILIDEPTPEKIALKLKQILENEEYYKTLKENCKKEKEKILSVETYCDILTKEYEKLVVR